MKRARTFMIVFIVETIGVLMFLGCSSPKNKKKSDATSDPAMIFDPYHKEASVSNVGIDYSQPTLVAPQKTDATSALDLSINPYYDAGYDQGQDDGYYDGIENIRGDSYDDACRYKGKKRKEYELEYEEGYDAGFDDGFADSDCDSEEEE